MRALSILFILPAVCAAAIVHVPADYTTIQEAIDASVNGDTVCVAPGTYLENIDFKAKAITVTSDQGPVVTTIRSPGSGSVVTFKSGEGPDSILKDFTIYDGVGTYFEVYPGNWRRVGGGIFCHDSSPKIVGNIIRDNNADSGCGLYLNGSSAHIVGNTITKNWGDGCGGISCAYSTDMLIEGNDIFHNNVSFGTGGIGTAYSSLLIIGNRICNNGAGLGVAGGVLCGEDSEVRLVNNLICENSAIMSGGLGGGIYCQNASSVKIINNTIVGNKGGTGGGGIYCGYVPSLEVINTIMRDNEGLLGPEMYIAASTCSLSCSNLEGGQTKIYLSSSTLNWGPGMLDADPHFVDGAGGDYHLSFLSPCRGSGDNAAAGLPSHDFEGDPRTYQGTVDMGADEFYTHLYVTGDAAPGGSIEGKLLGLPGTDPVALFIGSSVLPAPVNTMWGSFHLGSPFLMLGPLGALPPDGVMVLPATVPSSSTPPYDVPMQALIGLNPDSLTNLFVLKVR